MGPESEKPTKRDTIPFGSRGTETTRLSTLPGVNMS